MWPLGPHESISSLSFQTPAKPLSLLSLLQPHWCLLLPHPCPYLYLPFSASGPVHSPFPQPGRLFHQHVASFLFIILQLLGQIFLSRRSLLSPPNCQISHYRFSAHQVSFFSGLITITNLYLFVWLIIWLLFVLPQDCMIHKARVPVKICSFSYPHHLTLCLAHVG